jgi:hypothetical protein
VIALGIVSLFNDMASEIVVPLIPILLASVLGAGPIALGLVEGVVDAVAAFLKLWSGRHSDALGGRRKGLALAGYSLSNLARPLLALAGTWGVVLLLRSVDRVGKGLRSAPRDALVADATPAFPAVTALCAIVVVYALFAGLGEGAERAVISDFSTDEERGTAFGWYNLMLGVAAIPSGLLFGGMWHYRGPLSAFLVAALIAISAVALLWLWAWPRRAVSAA